MIKLKGPGAVLGIILICAGGWAALITFLIDNFLIGAVVALAGGVAIGAVVAYLMRRWWFKI